MDGNKIVTTNTVTIYTPRISHHPERPSLNKTNMKQPKTKADPVSFWSKVNNIGINIIPKVINIFLLPSNLISNPPKYFESANAVAYLANSLG